MNQNNTDEKIVFYSTLDMKLLGYSTVVSIISLGILAIVLLKISHNYSMLNISPSMIYTLLLIMLIISTAVQIIDKKNKYTISNGTISARNVLTGAWVGIFADRKISDIISIEKIEDKKTLFLLILSKAFGKNRFMLYDFTGVNKTTNILKITLKAGAVSKLTGANLTEYISVDDADGFIDALKMAKPEPNNNRNYQSLLIEEKNNKNTHFTQKQQKPLNS